MTTGHVPSSLAVHEQFSGDIELLAELTYNYEIRLNSRAPILVSFPSHIWHYRQNGIEFDDTIILIELDKA